MQLHEILAGTNVVEVAHEAPVEVTELVIDSRAVGRGALYACVPGRNFDGHDFAAAAVAQGAVALLVERVLPVSVPQVRVASVRAALGPIASTLAGDPSRDLRVVGITGTNGKTTTSFMLRAIAEAASLRCVALGTLGIVDDHGAESTGFTTPEAPELARVLATQRDAGTDMLVMEVSSHALAERRVDGTSFAATCFTNLAPEHLDLHGSMEEYFAAKARLFTAEFTHRAAINVADPHGTRIAQAAVSAGLLVTSFVPSSTDESEAEVRVGEVTVTGSGSTFTLVVPGDSRQVRLPSAGRFNVANAVAAAATAVSLEIGIDEIVAGLEAVGPVPGRFEIVATEPVTVIVDFAHTPDGIAVVLASAREIGVGRVIAVFGCGGDRDSSKRPAMGRAAGSAADLVVLTSDNPRSEEPAAITEAVVPGLDETGVRYEIELDRRTAIRRALAAARPGDVVMILGKGAETGQQIGQTRLEFDDRAVAREELSVAWS